MKLKISMVKALLKKLPLLNDKTFFSPEEKKSGKSRIILNVNKDVRYSKFKMAPVKTLFKHY